MCRTFECGVLRQVSAGTLTEAAARKHIRKARKLADGALALLRETGNHEEERPLTKRFQTVMREPIDQANRGASDRRGRLMLAFHDLMELVHARFLKESTDHD